MHNVRRSTRHQFIIFSGLTVVMFLILVQTNGQIKAHAISYRVTLELGSYDAVYYWQTDADTITLFMEVDTELFQLV
jgi:hypothetical protein